MITFGRDICGDLENSMRREWLVTNGTGSYACGTIAGANTRCYHGVLIAALQAPVARTLLVAKIDATAHLRGTPYPLDTQRVERRHDRSARLSVDRIVPTRRLHSRLDVCAGRGAAGETPLDGARSRHDVCHVHARPRPRSDRSRSESPHHLSRSSQRNAGRLDAERHTATRWDHVRVEAFDGATPYFVKMTRGTVHADRSLVPPLQASRRNGTRPRRCGRLFTRRARSASRCSPARRSRWWRRRKKTPALDWQAALDAEQKRERALIEQAGLEQQPDWIQQLGAGRRSVHRRSPVRIGNRQDHHRGLSLVQRLGPRHDDRPARPVPDDQTLRCGPDDPQDVCGLCRSRACCPIAFPIKASSRSTTRSMRRCGTSTPSMRWPQPPAIGRWCASCIRCCKTSSRGM